MAQDTFVRVAEGGCVLRMISMHCIALVSLLSGCYLIREEVIFEREVD